jgi:hypothetical protein
MLESIFQVLLPLSGRAVTVKVCLIGKHMATHGKFLVESNIYYVIKYKKVELQQKL